MSTNTARIDAGLVLYAKDMNRVATFYAALAGLAETQRERDFVVLERDGFQLVIVAAPEAIAAQITIGKPPRRREDTPIKPVFVVSGIDAVRAAVVEHGGCIDATERAWSFGPWRVCDGCDPEGNVLQLRDRASR